MLIRIHAIRGLELICKNNPSTVRRIAEMLGQLLVSEEKLELAAVKATFTSLFAIDPQAAFLALFTLVSTGVDANLRSKGLEFLITQLKAMQGALRKDEAVAAGLCAGLKAMLAGAQNAIIGREDLKFLVQTLISLCPHGNNAAKIKADEALKAELANIALTQSGLAGGALDLNNEAALRHFLAVQSVVANLANNYAIDTAPFQQLYFAQLLPNLELIQSTELRTQLLRAVANGASKIQPKQAQTFFPSFYASFKKFLPTGEIVAKAASAAAAAAAAAPAAPAADGDAMTDAAASESSAAAASSTSAPSSSVNFAFAEVFVYLFHILASQAPSQLRAATGVFTPTGQPGDFDAAPGALRDEFNNRVQFLLQQNAAYKEQLHTVQRKIQDEIKAFNKKNQAARAAAKPAAAAAVVSPAAAGQPVVEKKEADAAPAAAAAPAGVADESALIQTLRSKLQSVNFAIRIAGSIAMLAKPLLDKPLPTLMAADKMGLSWREFKANDKAAQGKQPAGQQQQQQQKGAKGQQQQQSQSQQKGQKRKSGGGDAQSNKKQSQGAASNKKQSGGQQQQQQGQANKKQRQSASNKGGNQNNGGGRRRR